MGSEFKLEIGCLAGLVTEPGALGKQVHGVSTSFPLVAGRFPLVATRNVGARQEAHSSRQSKRLGLACKENNQKKKKKSSASTKRGIGPELDR